MRAAVLHEYGTPVCGEFAEPAACGGQVVVEVAAAAVNPFDVGVSSGTFVAEPALPCVAGSDGVGCLPDGRRVYFESTVAPFGAAAEKALAGRSAVVEVPAGLAAAAGARLTTSISGPQPAGRRRRSSHVAFAVS
jgi:NADPH2:quinone reductase